MKTISLRKALRMLWISVMMLSLLFVLHLQTRAQERPNDRQIMALLQERVEVAKTSPGIVVGIIDEQGSRVISYGNPKQGSTAVVDGDTLYEIGSVTKVFTTELLADMVVKGEVKLEDPVSKYLPASMKVPERNGRKITLLDLATQTSALPRLPDNMAPADSSNPYADYSVEQLYAFLSGYTLTRDIGAKYEYSNLGMGLLGHVLALKAGTNYEALVTARLCRPLGMTNTFISLSAEAKKRLASGHSRIGQPVANWDLPTLAGAGALRSSVNDMLKFVAANLTLTNATLKEAMSMTHTPRVDVGPGMKISLGWHVATGRGAELIWHNGGTGGYRSFIGFDKKRQRGVVVLSNSENNIDDIGFHLLEPKYPLEKVGKSKVPPIVPVKAEVLKQYVGRYQLQEQFFFNVRVTGDHLQVQLTGQAYLNFFPESETKFFCDVVDAKISFQKDAQAKVVSLTLHQNGLDQVAKKISDEVPKEREAVRVDPKIYDSYLGKFELAPGAVFTVKKEGSRLLVQLTGQPFFEVFPSSETKFFYRVVDAQLTFVKNKEGEVTSLILHQNGLNQEAKRLK